MYNVLSLLISIKIKTIFILIIISLIWTLSFYKMYIAYLYSKSSLSFLYIHLEAEFDVPTYLNGYYILLIIIIIN